MKRAYHGAQSRAGIRCKLLEIDAACPSFALRVHRLNNVPLTWRRHGLQTDVKSPTRHMPDKDQTGQLFVHLTAS